MKAIFITSLAALLLIIIFNGTNGVNDMSLFNKSNKPKIYISIKNEHIPETDACNVYMAPIKNANKILANNIKNYLTEKYPDYQVSIVKKIKIPKKNTEYIALDGIINALQWKTSHKTGGSIYLSIDVIQSNNTDNTNNTNKFFNILTSQTETSDIDKLIYNTTTDICSQYNKNI